MSESSSRCEPLISLAKAARFGVLQQLFCKVTVTEAVRDEVRAGHNLPGSAELEAAVDAGWLDALDQVGETRETGARRP